MALIVGGIDTDMLSGEIKAFLVEELPRSLGAVAGDLEDWVDDNEARLEDWLDALMERLEDWVDRISEDLSDAGAEALEGWLDHLEEDLEEFLESGLEALDDQIDGSDDSDEIRGGGGDDLLRGGRGSDKLLGGVGADRLIGGCGKDVLKGGSGDDALTGGRGRDVLNGGSGADTFVFTDVECSGRGKSRDKVFFSSAEGDALDLARIDACETEEGDQAFGWIGRQAFTGAEGELRYKGGKLMADTDGDGEIDFMVKVIGDLTSDDILF